jgi:hypothetical protein
VGGRGIGGPGGPRTRGVTRPPFGHARRPPRRRLAWSGRRPGPRRDSGAPAGNRVWAPQGRCRPGRRLAADLEAGASSAWGAEACGRGRRVRASGPTPERRCGRNRGGPSGIGDRAGELGSPPGTGDRAMDGFVGGVKRSSVRGIGSLPKPLMPRLTSSHGGSDRCPGGSAAIRADLGGGPNRAGTRQLV